jgi:hypothetical protein
MGTAPLLPDTDKTDLGNCWQPLDGLGVSLCDNVRSGECERYRFEFNVGFVSSRDASSSWHSSQDSLGFSGIAVPLYSIIVVLRGEEGGPV